MKSANFYLLTILFIIGSASCSYLPKLPNYFSSDSSSGKSQNYNLEKDAVIEIRTQLENGKFDLVKQNAADFVAKYPRSTFTNEALYLQGLGFEFSEDWDLALDNYKKVIDLGLDSNKEFVALALYRKANCFEAQQEPELALASLFDALHYKAYLPIEVAEAEVPARMASIYARLKQTPQADYYTLVAEKGVRKARQIKKNSDQSWLGYTLLQMGSLPLGNLDPDSYDQALLSFSRHQKYLLQTIELKDPVWSAKAEDLLVNNYVQFWNIIKNYNINPSSDWEMDYVVRAEKQVDMASQLLESLEILKNYQAPDEAQSVGSTGQVYEKLKPIEESAFALVQKQILIKPSKKLKAPVISGNFDITEFEDATPKDVAKNFPPKTVKELSENKNSFETVSDSKATDHAKTKRKHKNKRKLK